MYRLTTAPRAHWRAKVEKQGLVYAVTADGGAGQQYWDESAYYQFSLAEVEWLEQIVEQLHEMCLAAVGHVIDTGRFAEYGITDPRVVELIRRSWRQRDTEVSVYGRFDLRYDNTGTVKLLEYNADTPTSLLEAAGPQWFWLEELFPQADQWNSLHERLIESWRRQRHLLPQRGPVHFAYTLADEIGEDMTTAGYLQETAEQAGLHTTLLAVEEIGWDRRKRRFVDLHNREIKAIFKLYPWEWLVSDRFGEQMLDLALDGGGPMWIEPAWKMLLSNKALLAILWELFPGNPFLLPTYLDGPRELADTGYVAKPLLGREGAGIRIVAPGFLPAPPPPGELFCYQQFCPLPEFDGARPVLGAWCVDGESAGLGIRESSGPITDTTARFVPHLIR